MPDSLPGGKISILVPVYNAARTLPACIASVFAQRDADFELILVDDGATDGSGAICDDWASAHPDCVRALHQENRGLIMARRAGVAAATGDTCMFLDSDDELAPDCLASVRSAIGRTGADMVIFNYDNVYEPTGAVETDEVVFPDGSVFSGEGKRAIYEEMNRGWRLNNLCTKAIAADLVKADPTPYETLSHIRLGEDLLQSLYPVTHARTVAYLAKPLYRYKHSGSSMTSVTLHEALQAPAAPDPVSDALRSYLHVWRIDTPRQLAVFNARQITDVIHRFWQHYRAAATPRERREVVRADWKARLTKENLRYVGSAALPLTRRVQIWAILHHNAPLIALIEQLGGRRLRNQYGK